MKKLMIAAMALAGMAASSPAFAVTTTLDFSGNVCGGGTACSNSEAIDQSYGDGVGVDVSYRSLNHPAGTVFEGFLKYWNNSYGDLLGVVWGGANDSGYRSEITLTAATGYEISLRSFDVATYLNRSADSPFDIASLGGTNILAATVATSWPTHNHVTTNSAYFTDGIRLSWGPDGYDVGLDNIVFDVRAVSVGPPVPEPATWAMMILGFGGVGAVMRKRRRPLAAA